ncbi:MAG: hypothetical protein RMI56_00360 [Sulfolobales archaeon]|nr:hypothetical protein [Sulfolobales archaeon]MDW8082232.1 hypothetical protein [Sulfolobales archaeon]
MALLIVVVGVGGALIGVANSIRSSIEVEAPPKLSAYLAYGRIIVVSWDDRVLRVDVVCVGLGVVRRLEIQRGVTVVEASCSEVVVVFSNYVIKPVEVVR